MHLEDFLNPAEFPHRRRDEPLPPFALPQLTGLKKGVWSQSTPLHITIFQYVLLLFEQRVVGYDRNRGGQPINFPKIQKWFGHEGAGFLVEALGEFPLGDFRKDHGCFKLATNHHRSAFLLYTYWMASPEIWNAIKDEEIAIRIFNSKKFVHLYCASDDMTKQALYGFLRNPDMVLGHIISCDPSDDGHYNGRLSSMLTVPARNLIVDKNGYFPPLSSIIYAQAKKTFVKNGETKNMLASHASVYNARQKAKKLVNVPYVGNEQRLVVEDAFLTDVANAIEDFLVFHNEFDGITRQLHLTGVNTEIHRKILANTSFFTFYLQERLFFKTPLPAAKVVAERLSYQCNGPESLGDQIQYLWNGDELAINKRADKITEVLRRPLPKKKAAS